MAKVWVVFPTLNRYQHARIAGARKAGLEVGVIEISSQGSYPIPGWRAPEADLIKDRVAVFDDRMAGEVPKHLLKKELRDTLERLKGKIEILALLGWGNREANVAHAWAHENGIPCLLFSETTEVDRRKTALGEWVKRRLVAGFSSALVGGEPHAAYLRKLGMPAERIFVGYNAVDNAHFAAASTKHRSVGTTRPADGGSHRRKRFMCACRLIEIKNLDRLVEAYAMYRGMAAANGLDKVWDLVIVGSGPQQGVLEETIRRLGLDEHVHLPGVMTYEEMPAWYAGADAFVLPSLSEPWGLVVNEAMACGLPVLVSRCCGSAASLVQHGVNGYTFEPTDVRGLADMMQRIAALPSDALTTMGEKSRQMVDAWGPERFAEEMRLAVKKALEVRACRPSLVNRMLLKLLILK